MLLVVGVVSDVTTLFLHAKAVALLQAILANTYLRWYGLKPIRGQVFIALGGLEVHVCNNFLSPTYIRMGFHHPTKFFFPSFPSFHMVFVAPRLGQGCVNWIAKHQYINYCWGKLQMSRNCLQLLSNCTVNLTLQMPFCLHLQQG